MQLQTADRTPKNLNFKAHLAAKVVTKASKKEILLYSLDKTDKPFADRMVKKLNLEHLYPNQKDYNGFLAWKNIIKGAVSRIGLNEVFLAVHNKRPCGIIAFRNETNKTALLSRIATWPIKPEEKVEHAGKSLMRTLFQHVINENQEEIILTPSKYDPRGKSCKTFYSFFGFSPNNGGFSTHWLLDGSEVRKKCAQLENAIDFKQINSSEEVNLNQKLTLNFHDTLLERISCKIKHFIN